MNKTGMKKRTVLDKNFFLNLISHIKSKNYMP